MKTRWFSLQLLFIRLLQPSGPFGLSFDFLLIPIIQLIYTVERATAKAFWFADGGLLNICLALDRLREKLVTNQFQQAIQFVADQVNPLLRPIFILALTLGLFTLILVPLVKLKFFDFRRGFALAMLATACLPVAGVTFQDLETERANLGSTFYRGVYDRLNLNLVPNATGNRDMGQLQKVNERSGDEGTLHALDVVAAFLYAERGDIEGTALDGGLPHQFVQTYFSASRQDIEQATDNEGRWTYIQTGGDGIFRMVCGFFLAIFALLETTVNLLFTLAFGLLFIALVVSVLFAFLAPLEGLWLSVLQECFQLFIRSWVIAVCEAILLSAVISGAHEGNAGVVFGLGLFGIGLNAVFVYQAGKLLIASAGTVAARAAGMNSDTQQATDIVKGAANATLQTIAAGGIAQQAVEAGGLAYGMGVGMGLMPGMEGLTSLAMAMGAVDTDSSFGQGLYDSKMEARGEPLGRRAPRLLERINERRQAPEEEHRESPDARTTSAIADPSTSASEMPVHLRPLSVMQSGQLAERQAEFGAATGTVQRILGDMTPQQRREGLQALETVLTPMNAREARNAFFDTQGELDTGSRGMQQMHALLGTGHPLQDDALLAPLVEVALHRRDERHEMAEAIGQVVDTARDPQEGIRGGTGAAAIAQRVGMPNDAFGSRTSALNGLIQAAAAADLPGAVVQDLVDEVTHSADGLPSDQTANTIRAQLRTNLPPQAAEADYQKLVQLARRVPTSLVGYQPAARHANYVQNWLQQQAVVDVPQPLDAEDTANVGEGALMDDGGPSQASPAASMLMPRIPDAFRAQYENGDRAAVADLEDILRLDQVQPMLSDVERATAQTAVADFRSFWQWPDTQPLAQQRPVQRDELDRTQVTALITQARTTLEQRQASVQTAPRSGARVYAIPTSTTPTPTPPTMLDAQATVETSPLPVEDTNHAMV